MLMKRQVINIFKLKDVLVFSLFSSRFSCLNMNQKESGRVVKTNKIGQREPTPLFDFFFLFGLGGW